ncbi:hypothetical protein [Nonlabens sp.]|uniref:hypothetical protein n=1 Tax=Nonlabens sp. TaxID=1888209 RepID=UPI003F695808
MKKSFAYVLIVVVVILCGVHISRINWDNLSWDANQSPYTGLVIAVLIGALVIYRTIKGTPHRD